MRRERWGSHRGTGVSPHPPHSREELANYLTHGVGFVASLVGGLALVISAALRGNAWHWVGCTVFASTLVLLYSASTLYHVTRAPARKSVFRVADHCCIYLLIAGSYTPFVLTALRGGLGWTLLAAVWAMALLGIAMKVLFRDRFVALSIVAYVAMGWVSIVALPDLLTVFPWEAVAWVVVGGLSYTGGIVFFAWESFPYNHAIWHLFVMAGSLCHYVAVMSYIVP